MQIIDKTAEPRSKRAAWCDILSQAAEWCFVSSQLVQPDKNPTLFQSWANVSDVGPALRQFWVFVCGDVSFQSHGAPWPRKIRLVSDITTVRDDLSQGRRDDNADVVAIVSVGRNHAPRCIGSSCSSRGDVLVDYRV